MAEDIYWTPPPSPKQDIYWEPPAPPPLPLPPPQQPVDTRSTFQKFLDWAGEPTLPEAEPYPLDTVTHEQGPLISGEQGDISVHSGTVPYAGLKKFANDIVFEPYNQLIRPVSAPLGLAALAVEGGAGLYGRYQNNRAINAAAEAYRSRQQRQLYPRPDVVEPPIDVQATPTYTGPRLLGQGLHSDLPPETERYAGPRQAPVSIQDVGPVTETYNGPRQLGAAVHSNLPASTERYSGPRQAPPRLALPAQGETGLRTFYQGPAGTTIEGQDYPVNTTEQSRVPGWNNTPEGTMANLPAIDVARRGQTHGQLASSVASDFGEPEPFPQPEVNYPISTQLEQQPEQTGLQPVEPVAAPEPKPIATNPLYEIRQEGGGKYSVINTVTGSALVSSTTPETAQIVFDAVKGREKPGTEPTPTPKSVTLYRWQANPGKGVPEWMQSSPEYQKSKAAEGGWYTEKPENLDFYKQDGPDGRVVTIQVTPEEAAKYKVTNNPEAAKFSRDPNTEYYIPSQALSQIKPIESVSPEPRRVPATLTTGSVNLSEVENPERPFQVSTQPIDFPRQSEPPPDEPGQPPSLDRLPTAEKPELRPGGEVLKTEPVRPFRRDTLTPEEARALKGETTPVQPSGGPLPPFRVDTLTPEEAAKVRPQEEFEPAPTHMQPEPVKPVEPVEKSPYDKLVDAGRRVYEEASRTGERLTDDEIRQRARDLVEQQGAASKPSSSPTSKTPPTSPDVGVPFRKETVTGEGAAGVRRTRGIGDADKPVLKAGEAVPSRKDPSAWASQLSPHNVLFNHPLTRGVVEPIIKAYNEKNKWVRGRLDQVKQFIPGMTRSAFTSFDLGKASSVRIGKILDGLDVPEASAKERAAAAGIKKMLDEVFADAKIVKPDMGYMEYYLTHMQKPDEPGLLKSIRNVFKSGKLAQTLGSSQGDMYDKGLGKPSSPYVEPRTGQLTDIDYDIRRVIPNYLRSMGKEIFDGPAVEKAKAELAKIPNDSKGRESILKSTASWYIKNYTRYDSEAALNQAWRVAARNIAKTTSRSVMDWFPGVHLLHLGEIPTSVYPELGEYHTTVGLWRTLTHPEQTYNELAKAGLLYGSDKPYQFKTVGERYQSAAQFFGVAESLTKGIAYEGAKSMLKARNPGMSLEEINGRALAIARETTFDTSAINQMRLLSPESMVMGGPVGSITGGQFRQIPMKAVERAAQTGYRGVASPIKLALEAVKQSLPKGLQDKFNITPADAQQYADMIDKAKADPIKAGRMLLGTGIALVLTDQINAHLVHMNLGHLAKLNPFGPSATALGQIADDVFVKQDFEKTIKDLFYWGMPGGAAIKSLVEPRKPTKTSQNTNQPNPVGSVLSGGGLQAKVMGEGGIRAVGDSNERAVRAAGAIPKGGLDFKSGIQQYGGTMDEDMVREKFKELSRRESNQKAADKWAKDVGYGPVKPMTREEIDAMVHGETGPPQKKSDEFNTMGEYESYVKDNMPGVRPPSQFQKDPNVVDVENAKRIFDTLRKVAPQYMDKIKLISRAPTKGSMDLMAARGFPLESTYTNLMGLTDRSKGAPYELYIAPDMPDSLNTLIHEMMHAGEAEHPEIEPFLKKAFKWAD